MSSKAKKDAIKAEARQCIKRGDWNHDGALGNCISKLLRCANRNYMRWLERRDERMRRSIKRRAEDRQAEIQAMAS